MTKKTAFFEGWFWFKFNNLGLALGTNLKFYTRGAKNSELKVWNLWGLIPTFIEVTGEKLLWGLLPPPSWIGLNIITKHFIGYQKGEIVKPLCIFLPEMSGYIKYFENGGKSMSFLIKDDEVWDKYDKIWDVIK